MAENSHFDVKFWKIVKNQYKTTPECPTQKGKIKPVKIFHRIFSQVINLDNAVLCLELESTFAKPSK